MDRLRVIELFTRIVELDSFSAAARELRLNQSTASKGLSALEEELGVSLLERTTRALRVTEAGSLFYQRAKELVAIYDGATAEVQSKAHDPTGRIRVSVPVVFGRLYVVRPAARFMQRYPRVELEVVFGDRYVNLVDEAFDVAVRVGLPVDTSSRSRVVGSTPRRLVASPAYLREHGTPRAPEELSAHQCLLHSEMSHGAVWVFTRGSDDSRRARVRGRFAANDSEALRHMAREGLGVALLASWLVDDDIRRGDLVALLPDHEPPSASIQLLMSPSSYVHPRVRAFVDFLAAELASASLGTTSS